MEDMLESDGLHLHDLMQEDGFECVEGGRCLSDFKQTFLPLSPNSYPP